MSSVGIKIYIALICLLGLSSMSLAGPAQAQLKAVVSLPPQKYFVEKIGGRLVQVTVMVPPGADGHTYEPKPRQLAALASAKVYFTIGVEFESAWLSRFRAVNPGMAVIRTEAKVPKRSMAGADREQSHGQEGDHHGLDPHIWLSPRLVAIQARAIAAGLSKSDPANRKVYQTNLASFSEELNRLDKDLDQALKGLGQHRRILVYHPAWGYFCRDYGLEMVAIEKQGHKPTAKGLAHLIDQARREKAKVIFVQPQFSNRAARTLAKAINGRVVALDPLAEDWAANLGRVAEELKKAAY